MAKGRGFTEADLTGKGLVWSEQDQAYIKAPKNQLPEQEKAVQKPEAVEGRYFKGLNYEEIMQRYDGSLSAMFIPYDVPTFKNNKQLFVKTTAAGKAVPGSTDSKLVKEYKQVTKKYYESLKPVFLKMVQGTSFPLRLRFIFIRRSAQEFDYNNICQLVQDLMKDHNWIPDDSCRYLIPNFDEGYGIDKFNPGVIIKIL